MLHPAAVAGRCCHAVPHRRRCCCCHCCCWYGVGDGACLCNSTCTWLQSAACRHATGHGRNSSPMRCLCAAHRVCSHLLRIPQASAALPARMTTVRDGSTADHSSAHSAISSMLERRQRSNMRVHSTLSFMACRGLSCPLWRVATADWSYIPPPRPFSGLRCYVHRHRYNSIKRGEKLKQGENVSQKRGKAVD